MHNIQSLRYRIMGLTFLLIMLTVGSLVYLVNSQMEQLFREYLAFPASTEAMGLGTHEMTFLSSVHHSLIWVGIIFIVIGLAASYVLAKNITTPLRQLSMAAEQIRQGKLYQTVPIHTKDEVGQLAYVFNQMSEELAQNEQMRREFLANIAHELRTPLAILNGNLENMLEGVSQPDMGKLFSMQEEVMRLTRLVVDLRDLSLAELHQLEMHKEKTDMNLLLRRAAEMLQPMLEEKDLHFRCALSPELPEIWVDADRMNQVIYNVLVNAIRYTKPHTEITIQSQKTEGGIEIQIQDTGDGIPDEDLPYIFDHFYRGDKSRSRQNGGSGIGLSLAKQFVENHGGQITAGNMPDGGAVIRMYLPVSGKNR